MIALALPIGAQFIGYMIGLSSVLQPDAELGPQSGALGKLFEMATPVLLLMTGLYRLPLMALDGLFKLIPPGHLLPAGESSEVAIHAVGTGFSLALQLAWSPGSCPACKSILSRCPDRSCLGWPC
jgi:flagellar biosynthetic protein FliR